MAQSDGLVPARRGAPRVFQTRKALMHKNCPCGREVPYWDVKRWEEFDTGLRKAVIVGIRCECGTVNHRSEGDVLAWGRTIGAFRVPQMMLGLSEFCDEMLSRLRASKLEPDPDGPPVAPLSNEDLSRFTARFTLASQFQARMAGALVDKQEIQVTHRDEAANLTLRRIAEDLAADYHAGRIPTIDAEVVDSPE